LISASARTLLERYAYLPHTTSFPTRRSSDLTRLVVPAHHRIGARQPQPAIQIAGILVQPRRESRHHAFDHRLPFIRRHRGRGGEDRKSTRLKLQSREKIVCRLLPEKTTAAGL